MNPGYDWASRVGNRLGLWVVQWNARRAQRRLEKTWDDFRADRNGLGHDFYGPAIERYARRRNEADHAAAHARAEYDEWLARRPS